MQKPHNHALRAIVHSVLSIAHFSDDFSQCDYMENAQ
jgi:hypothetical protein